MRLVRPLPPVKYQLQKNQPAAPKPLRAFLFFSAPLREPIHGFDKLNLSGVLEPPAVTPAQAGAQWILRKGARFQGFAQRTQRREEDALNIGHACESAALCAFLLLAPLREPVSCNTVS